MQVRPITLDGDELGRWHDVLERGWMHERPWEVVAPVHHFEQLFREQLSGEINEGFGAYDGDELVGAGHLTVRLESNTDKLEFVVAVPPERRRRGAGRAMVAYAVSRAQEAGAAYAITASSYPFAERETHAHRRFADAVGLRLDMDEVHRVLELPVDDDLLRRLADEAAAHHEGYRIETWVDEIPEQYLDSWLATSNLLAQEAPMGEVPWIADSSSRESHFDLMDFLKATDRTRYSAAAISPDGEVVAFTDLVLRPDGSGKVSQWGTLVREDHRGHRLGTAVKVANIAAMQRDHPDRTEIHTTNAEVNEHMIGINAVLGFEAVAVHPCFYKKLR